jgi:type I restriction enzyme S subunit
VETELPEGWAMVRLAAIVEEVRNVKPANEPYREFGYVDISSICNETHQILDPKRFKGKDAPSRARRPIRPGDVLFSNVRTYLRNVAMVPSSLDEQLCSTGFTVLRSNGAIDPQLLFRYVLTDEFIDRVTPQQTGTHYPATSDRVVMGESVPLPPLAEQQRIVAKVEALLARVNVARRRLAKVPAILKRFRQSVLATACSGRLTADWREERTKADAWQTVRLGNVGRVTGGITKNARRPSFPMQVPYLRVANVYENRLELAEVLDIGVTADEFERTVLTPGDLLFVEGNGSIDQIGRVAIWDGSIPRCVHQNHLIRFRASERVLPEYALVWMMAPQGREQLIEQAISSAGLHSLSISKVAAVELELTNLDEQHEIVRRVKALFELAGAVENRVAAATARAEKLTQAILAKAFRGELVPTEAELARREGRTYEPASVLLERIRAERSRKPAKGPAQKRRT